MRWIAPLFIILCSFTEIKREPAIYPLPLRNHLIRVAVVDTGFNLNDRWPGHDPKICRGLSKDFTKTTLNDEHGHGTHIAGLIALYAENANYCLIFYKYYKENFDGMTNLKNSIAAFKEAIKQKVDVINYSGGGIVKNDEECRVLKTALDAGIKINAAAGNEGMNINYFHFYPAMCDPRINVIGALDKDGERLRMSNYTMTGGVIIHEELGQNVYSTLPGGQFGYMSGTSQATAIFTGKLVKQMALEK